MRLAQPPIPMEYLNDPWAWLYFTYFVLEIFLDAAIIASLAAPVLKSRSLSFFRYGTYYFGRFLRIALYGSVPTACLIFLSAFSAPFLPLPLRGPVLIILLAVFAVDVVADYARVQTVLEERTYMLLAWLSACRCVWQNGRWVMGISLLKVLSALALLAWSNVLLSFHWSQLAIWLVLSALWLRIWLKAVTFATQIQLARETTDGSRLFLPSIAGEIRGPDYRGGNPAATTKLA